MKPIAIMGTGMVGGALNRYFETQGVHAGLYDPPKGLADTSVIDRAEIVFVCVPTPYYHDDGGFDLSFVRSALDLITGDKIVVMKSTMIPGTTAKLQADYPQFNLMYNPEFLVEVTADKDTCFPERQILGVTETSRPFADEVMGILPEAPYKRVIPSTGAEMIKYFGNTWLSLKVTHANQMYDLCQELGVDYALVRDGVAADSRIGPSHIDVMHGGYRGYGGKCLPKDTRALIQLAENLGIDLTLLQAAEAYNNALISSQGIDIKWEVGSPKKT